MAAPRTMKAVVFEGPYKVSVQDRPVPTGKLGDDTEVVSAGCLGVRRAND